MKKVVLCIPLAFSLFFVGGLGNAVAQTFDISSGGAPTITGALGGSVAGSANVLNNLVVTINFGEVSPANTSGIVKVTIPIAIRSDDDYRVRVTVNSFTTGGNTQAVQRTDVGFGVRNLRSMGANARVCTTPHIFTALFNNDPATGVTINAAGRATYPSTVNNIVGTTTLLTGPTLSNSFPPRRTNNGYIFDAIFTITPQFYAAGTTTATLTFSISAGPSVPCNP